ncbi:DUF1499 domain-containing protein [Gracilimonas sediminicola]|uniref:DUF1499 domain-containing protein n=1 Tax=Gracilimonas sediminicola TaxID=2952158 RepID=UPI0038D46B07
MAATNKKGSGLLKWGTSLAVLGGLAVILSGYGYQWGWWHFSTGFSIIPWGTGSAILGGIIGTVGFFRMKERGQNYTIAGFTAMIIGLAALSNFGYWYLEVQKGYPPIHDITTDTVNPPEFDAIVPLRQDAPNPPQYIHVDGPAEAQREFYEGLETLNVSMDYDVAYNRALETVREMPWQVVGENKQEGRIEAYHKLPWFGFIDDVVIRVDTTATGSKIDVRSKSRIGRGDLGVNAKRIKSYFEAYQK